MFHFGLNGEISIYNEELFSWYAKLRALQYPVVEIPQFYAAFSHIVEELRADELRHFNPSGLNDFLNNCFERIENVFDGETAVHACVRRCSFVRRFVCTTSGSRRIRNRGTQSV